MRLTIQNMVCDRCIQSVESIFKESGVPVENLDLGFVEIGKSLNGNELDAIRKKLEDRGFALVQDRESELVERIKVALIDYVDHLENSDKPMKLSVFVTSKIHYNYSYLSKIYSDKTGSTVENHLIRLKIERVKELLDYRNVTLSEIAWQLKYSSVQYLSNQFKKVTGMTVTEYLNERRPGRQAYDKI